MNRSEAKDLLSIIQAFVEGRKIEYRELGEEHWSETTTPTFDIESNEYRIKPEPKYHSFLNAEECWQEMKKHEPFGWVKDKQDGHYALITAVEDGARATGLNGVIGWNFTTLKKYFDFADGTPFGIKVE